jgi:hypothetical protein
LKGRGPGRWSSALPAHLAPPRPLPRHFREQAHELRRTIATRLHQGRIESGKAALQGHCRAAQRCPNDRRSLLCPYRSTGRAACFAVRGTPKKRNRPAHPVWQTRCHREAQPCRENRHLRGNQRHRRHGIRLLREILRPRHRADRKQGRRCKQGKARRSTTREIWKKWI